MRQKIGLKLRQKLRAERGIKMGSDKWPQKGGNFEGAYSPLGVDLK